MANLLIDVFRSCVRSQRFTIHDFVIMPNHVHILITVPGDLSVEKAMQLIKGGFSFRAGKELGFHGELWQRGFSDVRATDADGFQRHKEYIDQNPVKAGLAHTPADYPYASACLKLRKRADAKAQGQA